MGIACSLFLISAAAGGWMSGTRGVVVACLTGVLFWTAHSLSSYYRYRRIEELAEKLNLFFHGQDILIQDQREGELSVLESEIGKLIFKLKSQAERLQQDKKYLADSIADISHQIRTPLTAMNLIVTRLSHREMSARQQKELLQELEGLLLHMDWLIQTLLKISKLDAGTIQMQKKEVRVHSLIKAAVEDLEIPLEIRGQTMQIECESSVSYWGDVAWMKEAIGNIVKNCMEHTGENGILQIRAMENALYTEIIIEDNGAGIATEDLPHIFQRFYKGKNSSDSSVGIGLALAKMIILQQGGRITAENIARGREGKTGARFVIRFYKGTV